MYRMPKAPQCPYCGDIASHGESRFLWIQQHLDNRRHRVWWWFKRKFKRR